MKTHHLFLMTSVIGLFVLVPCVAQEPKQGSPDPFGGPGGRAGDSSGSDPFGSDPFGSDPFGKAQEANRSRGISEVRRADPDGPKRAETASTLKPEERIRAELRRDAVVHFVKTPLSEAIEQLSASHQIPIVIDSRALEEYGLSIQEPVDLSVKNISLRSTLRLLLYEFDLTYVIRDEVLVITTVESAEKNPGFRVFPLPMAFVGEQDDVIKAVQATIAPDCWQNVGGPASIFSVKNTLVVAAPEPVLGEVESFLEKLADASDAASSKDARD